jgi:AAA+ superfamily predicted ATPase
VTASASSEASQGGRSLVSLPDWFPRWARELAERYYSGTISMFVLHGAVYDLVRMEGSEGASRWGTLAEFLAEQLFGRWDLVLHYDLARGLRPFAGSDGERLQRMVALATRRVGDLGSIPKDPSAVLPLLDRMVQRNVMAKEEDRLSTAFLLDHASYLAPAGEPGRMGLASSTHLVTLLQWATSPYVKRLNMAFVLCDESAAALSDRIVGNPHVASVGVPLPDQEERERFVRSRAAATSLSAISDFEAPELARLTAGISLTDVDVLLGSSRGSGRRLDAATLRTQKKQLLEKQAPGLLEFIEPAFDLEAVVGHEAVKARFRDDGALLRRGAHDSLPMGYLLCGAVGTGKTFLAQCASGTFGVPCVVLKNFRSKYVGETEGNLERVLSVLRAMGPVVVVVDEADAALGDRDQEGDSGTSSRVFGMIAGQMGDTRYRGRILWMLLTCRPDLLPIDLKRQGRAEIHVPLFYPRDEAEIQAMFVSMARKLKTKLAPEDLPLIPSSLRGRLSGADIEGIVGRAWRASLLAGAERVTADALAAATAQFLPSLEGLEKELQETAAILECTDAGFLPADLRADVMAEGGRARLQERFSQLKRMIAAG